MRHRCLYLLAFIGSLLALSVQASPASLTSEFHLDNGLKLVVREDHRAPTVVVQVWYKIGSSYEPDGLTGMSHALEHMMFKGTQKVPEGEFSRIVALYGGEDNAFTTDDYTAYYQVYTADKLPLALELEADRMHGLVLKPEDFAQEIRVIMEERRLRTDDNPQALAMERFSTLAWLTSPSRIPTVGWMRDLQTMKVEDLRHWYETWYAPNNATLVVAGDVDPLQVKKLADQYFAAIPAHPLPLVQLPRELPEPGERSMTLNLPGKVPALYVGFNVPSRNTGQPGEAEALRMLMGVLDEGISARLETRLVREQRVAVAVASGYDAFSRGDSLFMVRAVPAPGHTLAELEAAVLAEVEKLKTEKIEANELKRVYAGFLSSDVFERDSLQEQANSIGRLESVGLPWKTADEWPSSLQAVTPDAVHAVAIKYLVPVRRTVLRLLPTEITP
ncbi:MAG: pitrilysin family protein [bacterium]|nr:pitrilysin family protein [bacterium]